MKLKKKKNSDLQNESLYRGASLSCSWILPFGGAEHYVSLSPLPTPRMVPHAPCPAASAPRPFTGMRGKVSELLLGTSLALRLLLLWVEKRKDCLGFQGAWVPARTMGK